MEYQAPKSTCSLCGAEFARQGMARHINACLKKHIRGKSEGKRQALLHLQVLDAYNQDYFLHLLLAEKTTLDDLDGFLRGIWLECCGHMSAFSYERYGDEIDMRRKAHDIFNPGTKIAYQYDFGSTTELILQARGHYRGPIKGKIQVIARNAQPIIPCDQCNAKPAVHICSECSWNDGGWLCEACAESHECDDDMFLPVVNSPRTGVCGYTGV
jgi:hypothetical protein